MGRPKLYLIGAGPGDPELLTLKAVRAIEEADVILYDRLAPEQALEYAKPGAEKIYVGKHQGQQERTQSEIFDLIVSHAKAGKTVARLKGGDPMVFGRGGEECALALEHGIEVEIVPGISSAVAVPSMAGIPLTYRGVAQSFVVVAGHAQEGDPLPRREDWEHYASAGTIVVLMGVKNRVQIARWLMDAGRSEKEPAAFIERGTTPRERVLETTLGEIASGKVDVHSPAVLIVGDVVRLRAKLHR